jgi:hypothetical protein
MIVLNHKLKPILISRTGLFYWQTYSHFQDWSVCTGRHKYYGLQCHVFMHTAIYVYCTYDVFTWFYNKNANFFELVFWLIYQITFFIAIMYLNHNLKNVQKVIAGSKGSILDCWFWFMILATLAAWC